MGDVVGFARGDGYAAKEVASLLGVTVRKVRSLARVAALDGEKYTHQEVAFLRRLVALEEDPTQARIVRRALRRLRAGLQAGDTLARMGLVAAVGGVAVRDGGRLFRPESGQVLLDLDLHAPAIARDVTPLVPRVVKAQPVDVEALFERACELEESDALEARRAYEAILLRAPEHVETHVNLGRLLHELGDVVTALTHYDRALTLRPDDATATYNLGVALEDQGRDADAVAAYERTLALDATWADAHYNLARLLERRGERAAALRHLRAYRQLTQGR